MTETASQLVLYGTNVNEAPYTQDVGVKNYEDVNPQELGKIINHLQQEIKIIKLQLENLPGYAIGKWLEFKILHTFYWC